MSSPDPPLVSVVTPVFNGVAHLPRAARSLLAQTFPAWEWLLVDDASTDDTPALLHQLAARDPRIRPLVRPTNGGPGAARNDALRAARGHLVCYLDHDDEFYPDHLATAWSCSPQADVLVFAYDLLEERPNRPDTGRLSTWTPADAAHLLLTQNIAVPLAVAHHRELLDRTGLFHEGRLREEDADLWQRFARAGASFLYLPHRSGLYHVRADSRARTGGLAPTAPPHPHARPPRLLFCSAHGYLDPSSGAALSTRDLLECLAARGWACGVLCGPRTDFEHPQPLEAWLTDRSVPFHREPSPPGIHPPYSLLHVLLDGIPVTVYRPAASLAPIPDAHEADTFLRLFHEVADRFRPDVLLTYGGHALTRDLMAAARQRGLGVAFALHNLAYHDASLFRQADLVLVPSAFARDHYRRTLHLATTALPPPVSPRRYRAPTVHKRFVTFVNPQPAKGVGLFARLAHELARLRPDIPLLVVEGRGGSSWLTRTGLDLSGLTNLHRLPATLDPREFYQVSGQMLMPSLVPETFGRVAAEAMLNGIPVLATRLGSLPEVVADAGLLFDVPSSCRPDSPHAPRPLLLPSRLSPRPARRRDCALGGCGDPPLGRCHPVRGGPLACSGPLGRLAPRQLFPEQRQVQLLYELVSRQ